MKLVKFEDGTYGIRRWWFFGWYFNSLYYTCCVYKKGKNVGLYCKGTQQKCLIVMEEINCKKEKEKIRQNTKHKVVK